MASENQVTDDQSMLDANDSQNGEAEYPPEEGRQRLVLLGGSQDDAATFQFEDEDHTLGNALRYVVMKNPVVELCAYSIPHPNENKMNFRIQTYDNASAFDALEKGLEDLADLCDVVIDKFTAAREQFQASRKTA